MYVCAHTACMHANVCECVCARMSTWAIIIPREKKQGMKKSRELHKLWQRSGGKRANN